MNGSDIKDVIANSFFVIMGVMYFGLLLVVCIQYFLEKRAPRLQRKGEEKKCLIERGATNVC